MARFQRVSALIRHWRVMARLIENLYRALLQSTSAALNGSARSGESLQSPPSPQGSRPLRSGLCSRLCDVTTRGESAWMNTHLPRNSWASLPWFKGRYLSSYLHIWRLSVQVRLNLHIQECTRTRLVWNEPPLIRVVWNTRIKFFLHNSISVHLGLCCSGLCHSGLCRNQGYVVPDYVVPDYFAIGMMSYSVLLRSGLCRSS